MQVPARGIVLPVAWAALAALAAPRASAQSAPRARPALGVPPTVGEGAVPLEQAVASAGDVDGDGRDDLLLGVVLHGNRLPNPGEVRLFSRQASGLSLWAWRATGDRSDARFGASLAGAGDVNGDGYGDVLVGAPGRTSTAQGEGRAYLYLGSATGLGSLPAWTVDGGQVGASLGAAVAGAGDVNGDGFDDVLIGAPGLDGTQPGVGRVLLFLGSATGPGASPAWSATGSDPRAAFGAALSSAGDVDGDGFDDVILGAPLDDTGGLDAGRAFLYAGSPAGPSLAPVWTAEGAQAGAAFGFAVSSGDVDGDGFDDVIVGAPFHDDFAPDTGGVWLYAGGPLGLAPQPRWMASGDRGRSGFGRSIAAAGDLDGDGIDELVVGAPGLDEVVSGRLLVYRGSAGGPTASPSWTRTAGPGTPHLGLSVASAGDVDGDGRADVLSGIAAPLPSASGPVPPQLFLGAAAGLAPYYWIDEGEGSFEQLGTSIACAGDVDGDGRPDVLVGAPGYAGSQGRVQLFHSSPLGLRTHPAWEVHGVASDVRLGQWVGGAGDVNGDGFDDVLVSEGTPRGTVDLYQGGAGGLAASPAWSRTGSSENESLGQWLDGAGDVNGDGYGDVILAAPGYEESGVYGRALLFLGGPAGLSLGPAWEHLGTGAVPDGTTQVSEVRRAGDVNGDGYDDVVVANPFHGSTTFPYLGPGEAFVYLGSAAGLSPTPDWVLEGDSSNLWLGNRVASAGDVNADGYDDLLVGSRDDAETLDRGRVFLFLGSAAGLAPAPAWSVWGGDRYVALGTSLAGAGDVNGDGYDDVLLGGVDRVLVFLGTPAGLEPVPVRVVFAPSGLVFFAEVAGIGDQDGDGLDDWLAGMPSWSLPSFRAGAALVYTSGP